MIDLTNPQIAEIAKYLQDNYVEGIVIACAVVVSIYLIFSIRLVFTSKDVGMRILASAFIPGVNVILWVIKCFKSMIKSRKERRAIGDEDEVTL